MPAHPGFFARRELFDLYGNYREDYRIAADFELMIRFIYHNRIKCQYIGVPLVAMKKGGVSNRSLRNILILNREILRACRDNGLKTNYFMIYSKYFHKVFEFFPYFFKNASYTADRKE